MLSDDLSDCFTDNYSNVYVHHFVIALMSVLWVICDRLEKSFFSQYSSFQYH